MILDCTKDKLIALKKSCIEAQNGSWDKSDEGFDAMFQLLEEIQAELEIVDDTDYDAMSDDSEENA